MLRIRLRARCLAALLALPGIVALVHPTEGVAQYSVSPVLLPVPADSSDREIVTIVRNEGDHPLQLRVYAEDYDQDYEGSYRYAPFGTHGNTCAGRLEVLPTALSVPPGGSQPITVRMKGDPDPATCWSLVYVENPAPDSGSLRVATRIGIKVYGLSSQGAYRADITGAEVRATEEGRSLAIRVDNPDAWPILARGSVEIRGLEGSRYADVPVNLFSVLPQRDREVRIPLDLDLEPGRYLAIPVIEYGGDGFAGAQVSFRVEE